MSTVAIEPKTASKTTRKSASQKNASQYVQTRFDWDATEVRVSAERIRSRPAENRSSRVALPSNAVTVPTVQQTSCARRGRCEHVGGVMANVLQKYGIGLDDLLEAIQRKRLAASSR
jgi:hypothetical protein